MMALSLYQSLNSASKLAPLVNKETEFFHRNSVSSTPSTFGRREFRFPTCRDSEIAPYTHPVVWVEHSEIQLLAVEENIKRLKSQARLECSKDVNLMVGASFWRSILSVLQLHIHCSIVEQAQWHDLSKFCRRCVYHRLPKRSDGTNSGFED